MLTLRGHGLAFAHGGARALFQNVNFTLTAGWYGLVGANGAGKSPLLALLAQALQPSAGSIACAPKHLRVTQCLQLTP